MSDSTLRKKLEALWEAHFDVNLKAARESWGRTGADHMIDQLEALCQEVAREAYEKGYMDGAIGEIKADRQAQLTQKPAEETEGQ